MGMIENIKLIAKTNKAAPHETPNSPPTRTSHSQSKSNKKHDQLNLKHGHKLLNT